MEQRPHIIIFSEKKTPITREVQIFVLENMTKKKIQSNGNGKW